MINFDPPLSHINLFAGIFLCLRSALRRTLQQGFLRVEGDVPRLYEV